MLSVFLLVQAKSYESLERSDHSITLSFPAFLHWEKASLFLTVLRCLHPRNDFLDIDTRSGRRLRPLGVLVHSDVPDGEALCLESVPPHIRLPHLHARQSINVSYLLCCSSKRISLHPRNDLLDTYSRSGRRRRPLGVLIHSDVPDGEALCHESVRPHILFPHYTHCKV